jgi:dephospho-CoA kinase
MIKVGLTGEMAVGKTHIAKLIEGRGVPYYNCDNHSKELLVTVPELIDLVKKEFGEDIYEGNVYKNLAQIVFMEGSEAKLDKLTSLINPFINADIDKFFADNQTAKFCLIETATLYEVGMDKILDRVIYVTAPEIMRLQRAKERSGITEQEYRNRMKRQVDSTIKIKKSDYIIYNDDFDQTNKLVEQIYNHLQNHEPEKYVIKEFLNEHYKTLENGK